jgi:glycosyltransferase involved in cell wall biosynthesis
MKIGILVKNTTRGKITGIERYTQELVKSMSSGSTHEFNIISNELFPDISPVLKTYSWYLSMPHRLNNTDVDIIHNMSQSPTFFRFKRKNIITIHDLTPFVIWESHPLSRTLIYRTLLWRTLKFADKIIAVSEQTKKDLINIMTVPEEKIKVVYEAVNERFIQMDKVYCRDSLIRYNITAPFILYVGTLEPRKNIPTLIKAFYKIKKSGIDYKLVIAGKRGWDYKEIFDIIKNLRLQTDVIFTGYVPEEDLPILYNAADLFVYPSLYEGFGLPPLEAMACGTPVITSNVSSLPEVVGGAGVMVDPNCVDGLAKELNEVLKNDDLRKDLRAKGLERAKMFSWNKTAKETLSIYEGTANEY